jgi:hypothetical protein
MRYLVMSGLYVAKQKPYEDWEPLKKRHRQHQFEYDPSKEWYKKPTWPTMQ